MADEWTELAYNVESGREKVLARSGKPKWFLATVPSTGTHWAVEHIRRTGIDTKNDEQFLHVHPGLVYGIEKVWWAAKNAEHRVATLRHPFDALRTWSWHMDKGHFGGLPGGQSVINTRLRCWDILMDLDKDFKFDFIRVDLGDVREVDARRALGRKVELDWTPRNARADHEWPLNSWGEAWLRNNTPLRHWLQDKGYEL